MHPRVKDIVDLILLVTWRIICLFRNICVVLVALTLKTSCALNKVFLHCKKCLKYLMQVGAAIFKELSSGNSFICQNPPAYFPPKVQLSRGPGRMGMGYYDIKEQK